MRIITRTVWLLSFVSLLTDVASEMLYPIISSLTGKLWWSFGFMNALREIPAQIRGYYLMAEVRLRILPDMCLIVAYYMD